MIVFEIKINGKVVTTAGVGEYGFLFAHLLWSKKRPASLPKEIRKKWSGEQLNLSISGGIAQDDSIHEQLHWDKRSVTVGDQIVIRILERPACDEPSERESCAAMKTAKAKAKRK